MSDRNAGETLEAESPSAAWARVLEVLEGNAQTPPEPSAVKLATMIATTPCDVRMRLGRFELWHVARARHEEHPSELAAPVLHHLLRLMGLARLAEPRVSVLERAGLGVFLPLDEQRALWIVPTFSSRADLPASTPEQVDILVRETSWGNGPRIGIPVPEEGPWVLPAACPHDDQSYVAAPFPCPLCGAQPLKFLDLPEEGAFGCPECGESFVPRISRF